MISNQQLNQLELHKLIKSGSIKFAGNAKLKIYGYLNCVSGKRMKKGNRVFFKNETAANKLGYRPCGHCMRESYNRWKGNITF